MRTKLVTGDKAFPKKLIACSIHITCSQVGENGEMSVEMDYEGDTCLVAYLLEDAQQIIHDKIEEEALALPVTHRKCI